MLTHRLEKWVDNLSRSLDKWFDNREKKYANYAQEVDDKCDFCEIDEMLGLTSDPKNLKRFIK